MNTDLKLDLAISVPSQQFNVTFNFIYGRNTVYKGMSESDWIKFVEESLLQDAKRVAMIAFNAGRKFELGLQAFPFDEGFDVK